YWWSHDGSRFYYKDPRNGNGNLVRVKTVGVGVTVDHDPIVFRAPADLAELRVIPPGDPLNPVSDRYLVASVGGGILAMDLQTSASRWLAAAAPTKNGKNSFDKVGGPCFSPDGSLIAFGATRTDSAATPYFGVCVVPFFGDPTRMTRVTE